MSESEKMTLDEAHKKFCIRFNGRFCRLWGIMRVGNGTELVE